VKTYVEKQFDQVKKGDWTVLIRKLIKLIKYIYFDLPLYFSAVFVVLLVRLLKPFILIRFGEIRNAVIGDHFFCIELYLSERDFYKQTSIDYFYNPVNISPNEQGEILVNRNVNILWYIKYLHKVNLILPGGNSHSISFFPDGANTSNRDYKDVLVKTKPHLSFNDKEDYKGKNYLDNIGLHKDDKFVCIIVRDPSYKNKHQSHYKDDWSYKDYLNSDIGLCEDAALYLAKKGICVLRMGKGVEKCFNPKHPYIVDYALSDLRSDFLDVWLMANCYFCIGGFTGLTALAEVYRKPVCQINFMHFNYLQGWQGDHLIIFKKFWLQKEQCFMCVKEIINSGGGRLIRSDDYSKMGIELIENTSNEILSITIEMVKRLSGTWINSKKERVLQDKFRSIINETIVDSNERRVKLRAHIGAEYLKENQYLLQSNIL
jgi:putative glycosyltransferase (TIGR04372 family)